MQRQDIRPLLIDIADVSVCKLYHRRDTRLTIQTPRAGLAVERFAQFLQAPHTPGPGIRPNRLSLKSVILIPSLNYQTSPIATIPPSSFADLFNTHLLHPILTVQTFLPLLTARLSPPAENWMPPKVLVFTPSLISSLNPPFHAPEATVCSALTAFTEVLTGELRPLGIPVTHIQLGAIDFAGFIPAKVREAAETRKLLTSGEEHWPAGTRRAFAQNYAAQSLWAGPVGGLRGSHVRHLNDAVFDVLDGSNGSSTVRIGLGSSVYGLFGRYVPHGIVSWMMGIRKVGHLEPWQATVPLREPSPSRDSDSTGSHDFISVQAELEQAELEKAAWAERSLRLQSEEP
jgi:NAD(P)-dependent dehydrogenase (short-subunit alcohol dehydrogenase family)